MHHQCDPALTKEFDVSKKPFFICISVVWSTVYDLLNCSIHEISMVFNLKWQKPDKTKCRPIWFSSEAILQWFFVSYYLDKKEVFPKYHQFYLDTF